MPDITMCSNENCYVKEKCYRHTAIPDPYMQSYAFFDYDDSQGKCFMDNKDKIINGINLENVLRNR